MPDRLITFDELDERLQAFAKANNAHIEVGVRDPEVGRYARVLEYGSVAGQPPWPRPGARTTLAIDPESGTRVVVSLQAPQGFIRAQAPRIASLVQEELSASADWLNVDMVNAHIARAIRSSAVRAADMRCSSRSPVASGVFAAVVIRSVAC